MDARVVALAQILRLNTRLLRNCLEGMSDELRERLLSMGVEQGERLRRLLDELLDLSRLDAHAVAVDPKPIVVRSVLEEIAAAAIPLGTPVTIDAPPDLAAETEKVLSANYASLNEPVEPQQDKKDHWWKFW